jgi:hypothetical protein
MQTFYFIVNPEYFCQRHSFFFGYAHRPPAMSRPFLSKPSASKGV